MKKKEPYFRKEEIIHDGKRYRKYNNYVTLGGGFLSSTIRPEVNRVVAADFHFHVRREYFQLGFLMSGPQFLGNNHIQGHLGYGLRRERHNTNFACYAGVSAFTGVLTIADSTHGVIPLYYEGLGVYASAQAVTKFTYDIGGGVEVFGEYSQRQQMAGIKFILFFSGSYRGLKKNFNPNVRSETGK